MPTERDPDLPGGSDDPTRANDPVEPTRVHEPVDTADAQGAGPAASVAQPVGAGEPFAEEPRPRDRRPRGDDRNVATWLWALLAIVVIGIVLVALLADDAPIDTVEPPADTIVPDTPVEDPAVEDTPLETTAPETTTTVETTTTAAPEPADEPAAEGAVTTADGTDLLALLEGDDGDAERLAPHAGSDVMGEGVEVLDVVEGQGIWIGTDDQQRIFARTADEVAVEAGDRISFEGTLEESAAEGSDDAIVLPDDQGAEQLRQQGHHIELSELTPA